MRLKLHKQIGVNTKLFYENLGYKCVWNKLDKNFDELLILPPVNRLARQIGAEIAKNGFIPYHYALKFENIGEKVSGVVQESGIEKIEFEGTVVNWEQFNNLSGIFWLVQMQDKDGNNFVCKQYRENPALLIEGTDMKISCRPVTTLKGLNGEVVNLVNWVKVLKND